MILTFAFDSTIAARVLEHMNLPNLDKEYIPSEQSAIEQFVDSIGLNKYSHILGMGLYSGRDHNQLRSELQLNSKFKNIDLKTNDSQEISNFLEPSHNLKLSNGIGISYCNLVSYLIMDRLVRSKLSAMYSFVHIPKNFEISRAVDELTSQLRKVG